MSTDELIRACAGSTDRTVWEEFVSRFHRPICLSVLRSVRQWGKTPPEAVDDLVQETYVRLCADNCRQLFEFAAQHPEAIVGYIKTVAINIAHDYFKAQNSQKRGSGNTLQSLEDVDPAAGSGSLGGQAAIEREILLKQINRCLETCSQGPDQERDCLIFWLYYQQGMSAKAIAALPTVDLTAKGVESAILRLTRLIREQIVELRAASQDEARSGQKGFRPAESY
jgi:RNA polymerase sigma-70 factor (ECF subfamily)